LHLDWGTPDPRDPGAYPTPATTSMKRWAWEFLRRRDDYRRAWQDLVEPFIDGDQYRCSTPAVGRNSLDLATFESPRRVPPWEALRADFKVYGDPVSSKYARPYNRTLDPQLEQPPRFEGTGVITVQTYGRVAPDFMRLIAIDLTLPLEPQWENAKAALLLAAADRGATQAPAGRPQVAKFPLYLRLLDFRAAGAPNKDIREHLFPEYAVDGALHALINESFKHAQRWQQDYWRIALRD
jgi:hypothetical protein